MPNAYTELVVKTAKKRGQNQAMLVAASGLTKQVISPIWNDEREVLTTRPDMKTVAGLAKGLDLPEIIIWESVVKAMGIPLAKETTLVVELESASNADILRVLARRLEEGTEHGNSSAEKSDGDDGSTGGTVTELKPKPSGGSGGAAREVSAARPGKSSKRQQDKADLDAMTEPQGEGPETGA